MLKANILYKRYLTPNGEEFTIGGIQTYISNLAKLLNKWGIKVHIYQFANIDFTQERDGVIIHGINLSGVKNQKEKNKRLLRASMDGFNAREDILIFACESMIVKNNVNKSIAIQHGINWDVRKYENFNSNLNRLFLFKKALDANTLIRRIQNVKHLICVDYNFVNWYRSQVAYEDTNFKVIPNFADIPVIEKSNKNDNELKIIFARRLVERRGTRLFAYSIEPLMKKYSNIKLTIAGDGPDLDWLKQRFNGSERVKFITYKPDESLAVHMEHDIAVVPTIGSEGTSLSLLEAMASKCSVIATNVGGMTNVILDHYNGVLINPYKDELTVAIEELICDKELRKKISENAYSTVFESFNKKIWEDRWAKIIDNDLKKGNLQISSR